MKYNRICQILGIEKPVIQGPLSWLTDARLVAAVSNAGGLGVLGPNAGLTAETAVSTPEETAEKMREEIRKTKKLTEKPFGVNLSVPCQITTAHSLASWLTSSCRWIRLVQAMKHWPRRWEVYAGCVSACWKVIQMKDTLRWARASEISAASRA